MTIRDLPSSLADTTEEPMPRVSLLTVFRLGLFNLGLGLMAVLTLAVLNRVMISELGIPGTVSAGILAMSQLIAPARVWFGQLSDSKSLLGLHRTHYVRLGTVVFGIAVFFAIQTVWKLGALLRAHGGWYWDGEIAGWTMILGGLLALYGLAVSASSTPFTALLVDISEEENRSKIVAIVWSMLMVGIVIGGITGKVSLDRLQRGENNLPIPLETLQQSVNTLFILVPLIVLGLTFIATWRVERRYSRYGQRSQIGDREDGITLSKALKVLTA